MDVKAFTTGKENQIAKEFIPHVSHLPQLRDMDLHQDSIRQEGDSLGHWYQDPKMIHAYELIRNEFARRSMLTTDSELQQWTSDCVQGLQCQLPVDSAPKERVNHKMLPFHAQSMTQHEICDVRFPSQQVAHRAASSFGNLTSPQSQVDYSSFFEDGSLKSSKGSSHGGYNKGVATAFMALEGTGVLSPVGIANEMIPSPEQLSTITTCSDLDGFSDTGPFDGGPTFPGELNLIERRGFSENNQNGYMVGSPSLLEENMEYLQNLQQVPLMTPEGSGILCREICDSCLSTNEDLLEPKLLMPGSKQFHQGHQQPYLQFNQPSEAQSRYYPFQEDKCFNKITGQKTSQMSYLPSERSHGIRCVDSESSSVLFGPTGAAKLADSSDLTKDQRILCFYMNYCRMNIDGSRDSFVKRMHLTVCSDYTCKCKHYEELVSHFDNCHCWECSMCSPVRRFNVTGKPIQGSRKQSTSHLRDFCNSDSGCISPDTTEEILPPSKRLKIRNSSSFGIGVSYVVSSSKTQACEPEHLPYLQQWPEVSTSKYLDDMGMSTPIQESTSTGSNGTETAQMSELNTTSLHHLELIRGCKEEKTVTECTSDVRNSVEEFLQILNSCSVPLPSEDLSIDHREEGREAKTQSDQAKIDTKSDLIAQASDSGMRSEEPKIMGVSLIDFFTAKEVEEHLFSLRQGTGQEVVGNTMTHTVGENSCQLCAMNKLVFAPATYCSSCNKLIEHHRIYYWVLDEMGTRFCICTSCLSGSSNISFHGNSIPKAKLQKEMNYLEVEESWVQCDKCEGWQHQICALYIDKRDLGGKAEYVCPKCYLEGIKVGKHVPLPKSAAFVAKDLPTTSLSDYIERRLFTRLEQDREERAKALQKKFHEVPGAADLVVRVVLSVNKILEVNQRFLDIFPNENYPTEFPYRSKVILLFQKIEGVDVCLFGMYAQEFGSECGHPNHRCVYISYLDSIKYFRPEIKTACGESLRTFVYHEILVGYLDYCKKQGFATCYIWACPPAKGVDYILYCHPETQKTPKSNKLRKWYKSMLRKATEEDVVVDSTNLYDKFFVPTGEYNLKITAARLPYFDGAYWSVELCKRLYEDSQVDPQIKVNKIPSKRIAKAMGHTNLTSDAIKDIRLMQKLGQIILPNKEDFIVAHLQFTCTHCREVILSGSRWFCNECRNFQLCARCHDMEQYLYEGNTHTSSSGGKHIISQVAVNNEPVNTKDADVIIDHGYFENRSSFLGFCQGNHYQFDTLRRAKHSSMMILYHLLNSTEPVVGTSCCICHQDIVVNQGWHCEICPGFDACDSCYQRKGGDCHIHKLNQRLSATNFGSKNGEVHQKKDTWVRELLDVLMHASRCNVSKSNTCSYPNCFQIRKLFRHAYRCTLRVTGGCQNCQKTWFLLRLHSKSCRDSNCRVPRCMDLKKHTETLSMLSESR